MKTLKKKIIFIVFDGLGDRPIKELNGKTPLEFAQKPNLDFLAAGGICGIQNAMKKTEYPTSEEAHFGIFGYDYKNDIPGRGVLEGLGVGAKITEKDLVLRINFGTVDQNLNVIDPRAGNIRSVNSFCNFVGEQKIGPFIFKLYPGVGHRGVLVISGKSVSLGVSHHSKMVSDTDPHKAKKHKGGSKVLKPRPLDARPESRLLADALWEYLLYTHELLSDYVENRVRKREGKLPANFILTRGAGFIKPVLSFRDKYGLRAACIAGLPLYKGIGKYFGMDLIDPGGVSGLLDTNVKEKITKAIEISKKGYDFVFVHLKGADVVAEEDGDWHGKSKYIKEADLHMGELRNFHGIVCVTGDHSTPCILRDHSSDPVPILIFGGRKDGVNNFSEKDCKNGELGWLSGKEIMPIILREAGYV